MTTEFQLKIKSNSAAMAEDPCEETAQCLRNVAGVIEEGHENGNVFDTNGNRIGYWWLIIDNEE